MTDASVARVVWRELGTLLATAPLTGHEKVGSHGVETTPRRMLWAAFNARRPVPSQFLTGQNILSPGIDLRTDSPKKSSTD